MHSDALGDQFTNVIPASGRPEKGADHFLDLRSRLERSSLFRLARRCVPSCEKRAMGIGHILCNDPSLMRQTSRKDLRSPFLRPLQPCPLPWTNYQHNKRYQPCACRA